MNENVNISITNDDIISSLISSGQAFRICNTSGIIIEASEAYCNLFEKTREQILHSRISDFEKDNPFDFAKHVLALIKSRSIKSAFTIKKSNDIYSYFELSETIDSKNNLITGFINKTERTFDSVNSIGLNESNPDNIFNTITFPIFNIDANMIITSCNSGFLDFVESDENDVIGSNIHKFVTHYTFNVISKIKSKNNLEKLYETTLCSENGKVKSIIFHINTIVDSVGEFAGLVVLIEDVSERKLVEHALANSEKRFRAIIENSHDAIILIDETGKILYLSPSTEKITDRKNEFRIGKNIAEFLHPDEFEHVHNIIFELMTAPGSTKNFVIRNFKSENNWLYLDCTATNLLSDGAVKSVVLNVRDITERIVYEESLANQLDFRQILIDYIPYAIFIKDENARFIGCNKAYERDFGVEQKEFIGKTVLDLEYIPEDERIRFHKEDLTVIAESTRRSYELPIVYSDGIVHSTMYSVDGFRLKSGRPGGLIGLLVDITDRKSAEEKLRNISRIQSLILENSVIGIALVVNGKFEWANSAACDLFKYSSENIKGVSISDIFPNEGVYGEFANTELSNLETGLGFNSELRLKGGDERLFWCRLIGNSINPDSPTDGAVWMFENITERIEREAQIQGFIHELKELNATKDKFFSIIAHDLKSPLGSFKMATTVLYDSFNSMDDKEKIEFLSLIKDSASNVYSLLENLLEWSRSQRGTISFNKTSFDLAKVANAAIDSLKLSADNKKITISCSIQIPTYVNADLDMMETILRNLISNAIKFSSIGGSIFISVDVQIESFNIYVKDEGVGMTQNTMDKLFRIEETVTQLGTMQEKGTGLGLILCKEFVEMHGGKIWVNSELGKGSEFGFSVSN